VLIVLLLTMNCQYWSQKAGIKWAILSCQVVQQ